MYITINVKNKIAALQDETLIINGNSDYVIKFDFDAEWDAYETKTARFVTARGYTDVVFSGNEVAVPVITDAISVRVGVYAGNLHTTTPAVIFCRRCITDGSGSPADPTPDVYAQIMEMIQGLGEPDPETIAAAVADYIRNNPIVETDPTVPAWAKAAEKPVYTAAEVGAISQEDLQAATDAALSQAKESGLFDGKPGKDGVDGKDGQPGADGRDGLPGKDGKDGAAGPAGADGKSAYKYAQEGGYTGTEAEFAAKLAQEKFANPNALTFTGAVTGSYDGSAPLTVNIPTGGGGTGSGGESNLITRYIHSSNKEIYPTALDLETGVFTCENHGLTTGDAAIVVCDYWFSFMPYELIMTKRHSITHPTIRVVDGNTFTLQYDNADITYTSNLNTKVDVTKWHIEISNPGPIEFTGFSAKSLEVRVSGWVWGTSNYSLAVCPMVDGNQVLTLNGGIAHGKLGCDNNSTVCVFVSGTIYLNNEFECNSYVVGPPANDVDYTYGGNYPNLPGWGSRCATKQAQYTWPLKHHAKFDGVALCQNNMVSYNGGVLMVTNGFTVEVYKHG